MESADYLAEEKKLMNEPKYRNYSSNIDKALKNFEYTSEWADLISALGKLNKAISSNTQYKVIPRRIKISKRLAQCMHPALPSGVHLKTLESYDVIFSKTGPERLATELFIYSAGLFPLFGYAAMNVKPTLLDIYEKYFVPLGEKLRPALSGFLSGVLPGYESGLDHFERTNFLLTKVCNAVTPIYFYSCLWECISTNASVRLPAITYLIDHFNKKLGMQEQIFIMGHNRDMMLNGLCASLKDNIILVQRNTLEFLLIGFPMHTNYLNKKDLINLVTNALNTILRRDMSLNRRLYSWVLGNEITKTSDFDLNNTEDNYFDKYSKMIFIEAFTNIMKQSLETKPVDLKPYKILISLLDKTEIGSVILDYVLCDIIRTMSLSDGNIEVCKSANLLFATFNPAYIWNFMTIMYEKSCRANNSSSHLSKTLLSMSQNNEGSFKSIVGSGEPSLIEICFLMEFLLETISLEMYTETTRIYLPKVFLAITQLLSTHSEFLTYEEITASLNLCMKIESRVQPMITSPNKNHSLKNKLQINDNIKEIENINVNECGISLEKSKSDSKLNHTTFEDDEPLRRSNSNQFNRIESPKKKKKSKSVSKLLELDKEICPDTGQNILLTTNTDITVQKNFKKTKLKKSSQYNKKDHIKNQSSNQIINDDDNNINDNENLSIIIDNINYESSLPIDDNNFKNEFPILEKCIKQYEIFYQLYLSREILQIHKSNEIKVSVNIENENSNNNIENVFINEQIFEDYNTERLLEIDKLFDTLIINCKNRTINLQNLLNKSINNKEIINNLNCIKFTDNTTNLKNLNNDYICTKDIDKCTQKYIKKIIEFQAKESLKNSVKLASNLLVEMSTFPNCDKNLVIDKKDSNLPSWLKVLTIAACYLQGDKDLQLSVISTLFDLISLLKSQLEHTTNPGVTFVIMLPLLKFGHVDFIENKTRIFPIIISTLWQYLGDETIDSTQIASLLYQLHNCIESGLVETIIGNRMTNAHLQYYDEKNSKIFNDDMEKLTLYRKERLNDYNIMCTTLNYDLNQQLYEIESEIFKKFELLWHLGREKQLVRTFDKILLNVFDNLAIQIYNPLKSIVRKWLEESLLRGDLLRLLKPINKILFEFNTRRLSVIHIHLLIKDNEKLTNNNNCRDIDDDIDTITDHDVYAISSEHGNVKYHMDSSFHKKRSPIRTFQKKLFGVTLGNKNKTSNFVSDKLIPLPPDTDNNIGLIINPLDLSSDMDIIDSETASVKSDMQQKTDETKNDINDIKDFQSCPKPQNDTSSSYDDESEESLEDIDPDKEKDVNNKNIGSSSLDLKRFVGDCERVTEALSQHDRTKNRKTYRLTRTGNDVFEKLAFSLNEITDGLTSEQFLEESQMADEYFSSSADTDINDSYSDNLVEQNEQENNINNDVTKDNMIIKQNSNLNMENIDKRLSHVSKISNDSNGTSNSSNSNSENENENIIKDNEKDEKILKDDELINEKKPKIVAGTSKLSWELDKDILEKSKKNVEILRQSAEETLNPKKHTKKKLSDDRKRYYEKLHPFHTHMLLYYGIYDSKQTLYALQTLQNIIMTDARTFLCLCITTSIPSGTFKNLLIRHRKSIFGKDFTGNITNTEFSQTYRGTMYLEVIITLCLYFARSYFQKNNNDKSCIPNSDDIDGNCKIQIASIELLTIICKELIEIIKTMGKGLASYIADLMAKCKLQKIILHSINTSVLTFTLKMGGEIITEEILEFNYPNDRQLYKKSIQIQLLRLLKTVIKLEYDVTTIKNDEIIAKSESTTNIKSGSPTKLPGASINVKYMPNCLISQQPMFLSAILSALQADNLRHLHRNWTDLVTSSLNCFNFGSLTNIVISVIHQICNNIDIASKQTGKKSDFPPDYIVSQLEALTTLCHYCLLDNSQQTTLSNLFNQIYPQANSTVQSSNTSHLLNNIVHSFLSSSQNSIENQTKKSQYLAARNAVLSHLSRTVESITDLWNSEFGQIRQIKHQLLELLSPISLHHGVNFLAAVSVTWHIQSENYKLEQFKKNEERKCSLTETYLKNYLPQANIEQLNLVKLVSNIRVMPIDSFIQTLNQVIRTPPPIHHPPIGFSIEVSSLELFYFYMKNSSAPQLADSWNSLIILLRDSLNLNPPAQFILFMLLNEFVQRCPQMPFQDKKDLRDLHEVTSKLVDALSNIAGSGLEQTTWLRRNLAVKEDMLSPVTLDGSIKDLSGNQQYCVQAQSILASVLANLLDVAYGAQEKDKVVAIITTLMYNIIPYLKNHTTRNVLSFYACSNLLANLSSYQYTRKAWRKDMFDLLLDPAFFQMDKSCLPFWKLILDNLMTYDNTTFRDLLKCVSEAQTGGLNIFTSREQEYEQRALLLKRFAFVIFCSESDQYHKYMPEIQEQLVNSLRLPVKTSSVQAAVFLCFRVLLLRMSPHHVTSLWPIIIAEMVQVFLDIEHELRDEKDDQSLQIKLAAGSELINNTNSSNGLGSQLSLASCRSVQLEASKLLELGCVLPASNLPDFQMYRWAFVGSEFDTDNMIMLNGHTDEFLNGSLYVPHVRRIARLMDMKYTVHSPKSEFRRGQHLILTGQHINSLQDLYDFFSRLSFMWPCHRNISESDSYITSCLAEIEDVLATDFLEKMPTSTIQR